MDTPADDLLIVLVEGGLDAEASTKFTDVLGAKITAGFRRVIVDGRRMTYLGSQGIGALLALHTRCRKAGGDLKIAGLRGLVGDVIRTTGLHLRFDLFDTTDAARAAFTPSPQA